MRPTADRRLRFQIFVLAAAIGVAGGMGCGDDGSAGPTDTGNAGGDASGESDASSRDAASDLGEDEAGARDAEPDDAHAHHDMSSPMDAAPEDAGADASSDAARTEAAVESCPATCPAGETCCPVGVGTRCVTPLGDGTCPLPDLTVSTDRLSAELAAGWEHFADGDCAVSEGCVGGAGWRRLLRFSTETPNHGTGDMSLGAPTDDNPAYRHDECTDQYLFDGYADYALESTDGGVVASGRKRAFCLMDTNRIADEPDVPRTGRYTCDVQGISRGWSDVYHSGLECQWIDVTGVPPGDYTLRVHVNPLRRIVEASYDDNVVTVPVTIAGDSPADVLGACPAGGAGPSRDCGWTLAGTYPCTPGAEILSGCGATTCAESTCTGDVVMRVCPGDGACSARDALGADDDCSARIYCPLVATTCPAGGRVTVLTGSYRELDASTCSVTVR
ncbi:MAG: hypothetical protein IT379_33740 [Deltaproteobacteria bacterium]|nr:hypothetical protein [Deltaproteobacteria bacterium]